MVMDSTVCQVEVGARGAGVKNGFSFCFFLLRTECISETNGGNISPSVPLRASRKFAHSCYMGMREYDTRHSAPPPPPAVVLYREPADCRGAEGMR